MNVKHFHLNSYCSRITLFIPFCFQYQKNDCFSELQYEGPVHHVTITACSSWQINSFWQSLLYYNNLFDNILFLAQPLHEEQSLCYCTQKDELGTHHSKYYLLLFLYARLCRRNYACMNCIFCHILNHYTALHSVDLMIFTPLGRPGNMYTCCHCYKRKYWLL